ncbi:Down syndrome cell adhesion molecule-like protein 1 [Chamberlinius hualienensis]
MRAGITCLVTEGDLPIAIEWLKDGRTVEVDYADVITHNEFTSTLTIHNLSTRHNGNYTCVAKNSAQTVNHTAPLLVHVAPRWIITPTDSNVTEGQMVSLNCRADGFPRPTITWKKKTAEGVWVTIGVDYSVVDYKPLLSDDDIRLYPNGSLLIDSVNERHGGHYLCQAHNGIGSGLSKILFLKINMGAKFEIVESSESFRKGANSKLQCKAKGDLPLILVWKKNNTIIDQQQHPRMIIKEIVGGNEGGKTSELIIHSTERSDSGRYSCEARNNFGSDVTTIDLIVIEKPEVPHGVNVMKHSSRSVSLQWEAPFDGNTPIRRYKLQFRMSNDGWKESIAEASYSLTDGWTTTMTSLSPANRYQFRLAAENDVGLSNYSQVVSATTSEEAPSGPPTSITAWAISSKSLNIRWKAPTVNQRNGAITGYRIGYRIISEQNFQYLNWDSPIGQNDEKENELIIANLMKYSKYAIAIEAINGIGMGPASVQIVQSTLEDLPEVSPRDVRCSTLSPTSIKVTWTSLPKETINGILLGHKVRYSNILKLDEKEIKSMESSSSTLTLDNLQPWSNYSIRVCGYNRVGDGMWSERVHCQTQEDGRGLKEDAQYEFWVTSSTAVGEGKRSRSMTLSPHSTVDAKIGSFPQRLSPSRRANVRLPCKAVGIPTPEREWIFNGKKLNSSNRIIVTSDGSLEIKQFQPNDVGNYTCRVVNIYADDTIVHHLTIAANTEKITVPPNAPILRIEQVNKTSANLIWKMEDDGGSPITGYTLNYKINDDGHGHGHGQGVGQWLKISLTPDNANYTLSNLNCGTRYVLFITAKNKEGLGNPSNIQTLTTIGSTPIPPSQNSLFNLNSGGTLTIQLDNWIENICSIKKISIESRRNRHEEWKLVADNLSLSQKSFAIPQLLSNNSSDVLLKMTVASEAGITTHEYHIDISEQNTAIANRPEEHNSLSSVPFYLNLNIIIPVVVSVIVIMVIAATIYDYVRRRPTEFFNRKQPTHPHHYDPPLDNNRQQLQQPTYSKVNKVSKTGGGGSRSHEGSWQLSPNITTVAYPNVSIRHSEILRKQPNSTSSPSPSSSYLETTPSAPPAEYLFSSDNSRRSVEDSEDEEEGALVTERPPFTVPDLLYHRSTGHQQPSGYPVTSRRKMRRKSKVNAKSPNRRLEHFHIN